MPGPASILSQVLCWSLVWASDTALMLLPQGLSSTAK